MSFRFVNRIGRMAILSILALLITDSPLDAQNRRTRPGERERSTEQATRNRQRPDRRFVRPPTRVDAMKFFNERRPFEEGGEEYRTFNGTFNNLDRPREGSIFIPLLRMSPPAYGPNNSLARQDGASPRVISNAVSHQSAARFNDRNLSDFIWQWGQFIDHDLDLTEFQSPEESVPISIPLGDAHFDPFSGGGRFIPFSRSIHSISLIRTRIRQQLNEITAFIDASSVYGSTLERANALRTFENGRLRVSDGGAFGDLLPLDDSGQFFAGDIRAGEQAGLACMHTLFVREHNRLAMEIKNADGSLTDEEIYQRARKKVYAILEAITYNEWLPALMGPDQPLAPYEGYDPEVSPNIANEFSTAAFRIGHTMLNNQLLRLNNEGDPIAEGHILLRDAFFNPAVVQDVGIDCYLMGMANQKAQEIDQMVIGGVRNFLFANQPESPMGIDLASLNIQRGRDHGLPDFNTVRIAYGLAPVASFADLTSDPLRQAQLASVYPSVSDVDPWVGFLAEDHAENSSLGMCAIAALKDQFERVRDGDRFWYEQVFDGDELDEIRNTTLADVIRRNTNLTNLQDNVFFVED